MIKKLKPIRNNRRLTIQLFRKLKALNYALLFKKLIDLSEEKNLDIDNNVFSLQETLTEIDEKTLEYHAKATSHINWFMTAIFSYILLNFRKNLEKARIPEKPDKNIADNVIAAIESQRAQAIQLISSIPNHYKSLVKKAMDDFLSNKLKVSLTERIKQIYNITDNRAKLIARDQTNKTISVISSELYKAYGMTKYVWITMDDERVVGNPMGLYPHSTKEHGNHFKRHQKVFRFDAPPDDGMPGWAIQCRCLMAPIFQQ